MARSHGPAPWPDVIARGHRPRPSSGWICEGTIEATADAWRVAAEAFAVEGVWLGAEPISTGHINATWLATCRTAGGDRRFVLQAINTAVFREPEVLIENQVRVTRHLEARLAARGVAHPERHCLRLVPARDGGWCVELGERGVWRASPFIEGTRHHDVASSPRVAREAGRVFGRFAADLSDWQGAPLRETIPHFHDLPRRVSALRRAVEADARRRLAGCRAEAETALAASRDLQEALGSIGSEAWPERVVHNDCKLNNALFDAVSGEGLCAVDLDTVMPGRIAFDVGEIVRSATCAAPEDERDLSKVRFDLELFRAVVHGYLEGAGGILTAEERAGLSLAGPLMTLENAVRFLTDHLEGDVYFGVHRPGHNLDRARAQLSLFGSMWEARGGAAGAVEALVP
ncbi:MAG: phosphotransferase enzyme family protein [Myxococcota bacterium]